MNENPSISIQELIAKLQSGDKTAFANLYDQYAGPLYGIICKIVRSEDVGQDVLQDVFVKIWKNIQNYQADKSSLFTWMLNIARNTSIDYLRKLDRENRVMIQNTGSDVNIDKNNRTFQNENSIGLNELIMKLPEEQRKMVEYTYFNGYTQQEIADEFNMPLGTVKSRIRMAVTALRKAFNLILLWI